jgi:Pectate lyase superfamily protein
VAAALLCEVCSGQGATAPGTMCQVCAGTGAASSHPGYEAQLASWRLTRSLLPGDPPAVAGIQMNPSVYARLMGYPNGTTDWVSPVTFGAQPDPSGLIDSTAPIQAALNTGHPVYLDAGQWNISGQLTMKGPQQLRGAGQGRTILHTMGGAATQYNVIATPDSALAGFTTSHGVIRDLTIDCAGMASGAPANGQGNGLYLFGAIEWLIEDAEILNSPNWGIVLDSNAANDCYWTWLHRVSLGTGAQACAAGILNGYNTNSRISECVLAAQSVATVAAQQPKYTPAPSNTGGVVLSNSADPKYTNNILGKGGSIVPTVRIFNIGNHFIGNYFLNSDTTAISDAAGNTMILGNQFDQCMLVTAAPLIVAGGSQANPVTLAGNVQSQGAGLATWAVQGAGLARMLANAFLAGSSGLTSVLGGDSWNYVGAAGQPAFATGWSNFGGGFAALGFRVVAGPPNTLHLIGVVTAAGGSGVNIFTLPAGFRPASSQQIPVAQLSPATNWLNVFSSGGVSLQAAITGTISIDCLVSLDV